MSAANQFAGSTALPATIDLDVMVASATDLGALAAAAPSPCVYVSISRTPRGSRACYVGSTVGVPASRFGYLPMHQPWPVAEIAMIFDPECRLATEHVRLLERTTWQALRETGFVMVHREPNGAFVTPNEFLNVRHAFGRAAAKMRAAGIAFEKLSLRQTLSGPAGWVPPAEIRCDAPELRMETRKVSARAFHVGGNAHVLAAGSAIAPTETEGAAPITRLRRLEHAFSGILHPEGRSLVLTKPLQFDSISAMTRYVCGYNGANLNDWRSAANGSAIELTEGGYHG